MHSTKDDLIGAAFENHLAFIEAHRGAVKRRPDGVYVNGQAEFLSFWCGENEPGPDALELPEIRTWPWSTSDQEAQLSSLGYSKRYVIEYMVFGDTLVPAKSQGVLSRVTSAEGAREFATVQAQGFLSADDPEREWWDKCFHRMALKNYPDPTQTFHVSHLNGVAASVMLTVATEPCVGIYAVTTTPEYRGHGLSSHLLADVVRQERETANRPVILQVEDGSYAQRFYEKLGFKTLFYSTVYQRSGE